MPVDLSQTLVVGVSSRALFDMEEANRVYEADGVQAYAQYQMENVDEILPPGAGFALIQALLNLNLQAASHKPRKGPPIRKAEVVVMSRNDPATSLRMFQSIKHYRLDIRRAALSGGRALTPYLRAFDVDLFLTSFEEDVKTALAAGFAAGLIVGGPNVKGRQELIDPIRIAFDADAVVFSDEAERIYQQDGLDAFLHHEEQNARKPLPEGPFAKLLRTLSALQKDPGFKQRPVRLALVTARNMPAHERVIRTLLAWDVHIDEAFFMGGVEKTKVLEAFSPHIFFDDQDVHVGPASSVVPTAKVPNDLTSPKRKPDPRRHCR
ncbi:MAG: 5'-nucleotidase [Gemmataceae bacterium]|nr:5'-nucleotidase [Gemmataceae bacterium]